MANTFSHKVPFCGNAAQCHLRLNANEWIQHLNLLQFPRSPQRLQFVPIIYRRRIMSTLFRRAFRTAFRSKRSLHDARMLLSDFSCVRWRATHIFTRTPKRICVYVVWKLWWVVRPSRWRHAPDTHIHIIIIEPTQNHPLDTPPLLPFSQSAETWGVL